MKKIHLMALVIIIASAAMVSGCATNQENKATSTTTSAKKEIHVVSTQEHLTTETLSFQWRANLLKEMSNPSQGEDCVNATCTVTATLFSGISVSKANVTLNMVYMKYHGWYILIAPTTRNALHVAQEWIQHPLHFPYDNGVMIVRSKSIDYFWIDRGTEYEKFVEVSLHSVT